MRIGRRFKADSFAVTYYRTDPWPYVVQIHKTGPDDKFDRVGDMVESLRHGRSAPNGGTPRRELHIMALKVLKL